MEAIIVESVTKIANAKMKERGYVITVKWEEVKIILEAYDQWEKEAKNGKTGNP